MSDNGRPEPRRADTIVGRKLVVAPSGHAYVVRPLSPFALNAAMGGIADLATLLPPEGEDDAARARRTERIGRILEQSPQRQAEAERTVDRIVRAGLADPQLPRDAEAWALGMADCMFLFTEILALSGFTREAAEEVRPSSAGTSPDASASPDTSSAADPQTSSAGTGS